MSNIYTTDYFIARASVVHNNKYDYSKSIYIGARKKLIITCNIHSDFNQMASCHLRGKGCLKCGRNKIIKPRIDLSNFYLHDGCRAIPLNNGEIAIVDSDDYIELSKHIWSIDGCGYICRSKMINGIRNNIKMHRLIMNVNDEHVIVDHKDRDKLNNRKSNLRKCTKAENCKNRTAIKNKSSKYLGVKRVPTGKFTAYITSFGIGKHLGTFINEDDAAKAYDEAAIIMHGEFANLNFKS